MSRKTIHLLTPDLYAHVYNRGVNRELLYPSGWYYDYFLARLENCVSKIRVRLVAFTLMPNHFHLLLQQAAPYLFSDFMKLLCDGYAKVFNKNHDRTGHVFEGDYQLRPVYTTDDIIELTRYIHLNPVRAKLASNAGDWQYSSARLYCRPEKSLIVDPYEVLASAGIQPGREYSRYLQDAVVPSDEWLRRYTFRRKK